MSKLYASIQGSRGEATRQGHDHISGHVRGWDVGVKVVGSHLGSDVDPTFCLYMTGGSNGKGPDVFLGTVNVLGGVPVFTAK